eukprot:gene10441-7271_t
MGCCTSPRVKKTLFDSIGWQPQPPVLVHILIVHMLIVSLSRVIGKFFPDSTDSAPIIRYIFLVGVRGGNNNAGTVSFNYQLSPISIYTTVVANPSSPSSTCRHTAGASIVCTLSSVLRRWITANTFSTHHGSKGWDTTKKKKFIFLVSFSFFVM